MKRNGCIENNGSAVSPREKLVCVLYARVVTHAKPRWMHTRRASRARVRASTLLLLLLLLLLLRYGSLCQAASPPGVLQAPAASVCTRTGVTAVDARGA